MPERRHVLGVALGMLAVVVIVVGYVVIKGSEGADITGGNTSPMPSPTLPDNQIKVQFGLNGTLDKFDVRPSIHYDDGRAVVRIVDREATEGQTPDAEGNTEEVGEKITGYEGDTSEAFGHTFTFREIQSPDDDAWGADSDPGYVIIAVDEE